MTGMMVPGPIVQTASGHEKSQPEGWLFHWRGQKPPPP
ncbi:hypothetical protein SXCC_03396 [Gluconacetobacter sp. SXCC-1]|nr:hypothetical protein SXCC_03396 [Gluconacetobacter sp. SXCC-1]